jgi:hypothetical protein
LNIETEGNTSVVDTADREIGGLAADTSCEGPGDEVEALENGDLNVVIGSRGPAMAELGTSLLDVVIGGRGPATVGVGTSFLDSGCLIARIAGRVSGPSLVDKVEVFGGST